MKKLLTLILLTVSITLISQVTTIANGNWNNPGIWSTSNVPLNNDDVVINHVVNITSATTAKTITINGTLINNGNVLNVRGGLTNNGNYIDNWGTIRFRTTNTHNVTGVIRTANLMVDNSVIVNLNSKFIVKGQANINGTLNSNGNLVLFADIFSAGKLGVMSGLINGNFISQIYINRCNKWSYFSAPFNVSYDAINDSTSNRMFYTGIPGSEYPSFPFINTYKYITNTGYVPPTSVSENLAVGKGFCYWNSDTVYLSQFPSVPQQWKISTSGTINFNNSFNYNLSYSISDQWNLVGNPYPGTIDWRNNTWTKSNISTTIYMWNTCNQNWSTYNSTNNFGTNGATRYINQYQGFFVLTTGSNPVLSAPKSVIVDNSAVLLKQQVEPLPPNSLMISTSRDEMIISLDTFATDLYDDEYDALLPDTSNYLYSIKNNNKYIVNVLEYKMNDTVDISVKNSNTITFTGINTFPNHKLYLLDTQNSTTTLLNEGLTQSFTVNGVDESRFKIVLEPMSFVNINEYYLNKKNKQLIKRIDILGREVDEDYSGLIIELYNDGSTKKVIKQ